MVHWVDVAHWFLKLDAPGEDHIHVRELVFR
jgi:hypothetical protein